jgi:hypothetical protein
MINHPDALSTGCTTTTIYPESDIAITTVTATSTSYVRSTSTIYSVGTVTTTRKSTTFPIGLRTLHEAYRSCATVLVHLLPHRCQRCGLVLVHTHGQYGADDRDAVGHNCGAENRVCHSHLAGGGTGRSAPHVVSTSETSTDYTVGEVDAALEYISLVSFPMRRTFCPTVPQTPQIVPVSGRLALKAYKNSELFSVLFSPD